MKTESQKRRSATESGIFPKPDLSMFESKEASERAEHEKPDPASITGVIPIVSERADRAKDQDDSAAGREK